MDTKVVKVSKSYPTGDTFLSILQVCHNSEAEDSTLDFRLINHREEAC